MRKIFLICLIVMQLFNISISFSQITTYFTRDDKEVSKDLSYYYVVKNESMPEVGDTVKTFYSLNNQMRSIKVYRKDGISVNTYFSNYHENGKLKSKGMMKDVQPVGTIISYYPNGKAQAIESFDVVNLKSFMLNYYDSLGNQIIKNGNGLCRCYFNSFSWAYILETGKLVGGIKDSVWTGIDLSGNLKFNELYKTGELISGESYDSLGAKYLYTKKEEPPEYPGGLEAMYKFISSKMKYPVEARRYNKEGQVFIGFVVAEDGSLGDIKIIKGKIGGGCDEEAMRVIKLFPNWIPGKQRGIPVAVKFVLPMKFKLD